MATFFAVIGWPIAHSKSPQLYQQLAEDAGLQIDYRKIAIAPESFAEELARLQQQGLIAVNVTMPLKEKMYAACDVLDLSALASQSVNTAILKDGAWHGYNTDGAGFIKHLQSLVWPVTGKSILILGAGGAVKNIIPNLLAESVAKIFIANRTATKAKKIAEQDQRIATIAWQDIANLSPDLIIHASSGKMLELPKMNLQHTHCYDLQYYGPLPFLTWAEEHQAKATSDGYGMLLAQAKLNFALFKPLLD